MKTNTQKTTMAERLTARMIHNLVVLTPLMGITMGLERFYPQGLVYWCFLLAGFSAGCLRDMIFTGGNDGR